MTVAVLCAAAIVALAIVWATWSITAALAAHAAPAAGPKGGLDAELLALFAPGMAAVAADPQALLVWQPIAAAARSLAPQDFAALDRVYGKRFPFSDDDVQAGHARWTSDWLAWEQSHDTTFKLKAALAERDARLPGAGPVERAHADAVEREKLELYQRRYAEYVRVSKALQALRGSRPGGLVD